MSDNLPQKQDKADEGPKRFVEKGPHVIFDTLAKVYWMKKDSWQDKGRFFNWHEARDYEEMKNIRKIGGFNDWRLPTIIDIETLYDEAYENVGKGGVTIHMDPIFPEGAFRALWLMGDTSTRRPRFDFVDGKRKTVDEYAFGAVRLCRKEPLKKEQTRPRR